MYEPILSKEGPQCPADARLAKCFKPMLPNDAAHMRICTSDEESFPIWLYQCNPATRLKDPRNLANHAIRIVDMLKRAFAPTSFKRF